MKKRTLNRIMALASVLAVASLTACGAASSGASDAPSTAAPHASFAGDAPSAAAPSAGADAPSAGAETPSAAKASGETREETAAYATTAAMMAEAAEEYDGGDYEAAEEAPMYSAGADDMKSKKVREASDDDATFGADEMSVEAEAEVEAETEAAANSQIQAGQLTAGEWNDNENWGFFTNLVNGGRIDFPAFGIDPRFRTAVTVKNKNGDPIVNATVTLFNEETPSWSGVTDKEGVVYLFGKGDTLQVTSKGTTRAYRINSDEPEPAVTAETQANEPAETEATTRMTVHDAVEIVVRKSAVELLGQETADKLFGKAEKETVEKASPTMAEVAQEYMQAENAFVSNEVEIVFDGDGESYKDMQIMFIVDTTGSMGDELTFLQSEFSAIAQTVGTDNVSYSVNFYKDHGDTYVTKTNGFSDDIKAINKQLNSEVAGGGGDTPEAVSEILDECMHSQDWKNGTVKLAFLIFDAPPHNDAQSLATLEKAMKAASAQGIRVIPVVSSNTERDTELFGRGLAIFTGGTYVFLTDDSGIGDSHLEPIIGAYEVESLYDLMIRLIEEYRQ